MINDLFQVGSWAAKICWHILLWILQAIVTVITYIGTTVMGWLMTALQYILGNTGIGQALQPVVSKQIPYWDAVAVLTNYMASTFVGNGTLQFCLSIVLETLCFALILRAFFWIWAHLPIIGGGL